MDEPKQGTTWAEEWKNIRRFLCVRLDTAGAVIMTTPAIRAIKDSMPDAHVTLLTSVSGARAAALVPEIDEWLVYGAPWMQGTPPRADSRTEFAAIEILRQFSFDGAVIFTACGQSVLPAAMLCHLADIPLRIGCCRENPYQLLTHRVDETEPERGVSHEVRRQLNLVAHLGCTTSRERLSLRAPEKAKAAMSALLTNMGVNLARPWVIIHPGASAPSRQYPPEGFAEAARLLISEADCQIVFTGAAEERPLIEEIQGIIRPAFSFSLAGHTSFAELAALISVAQLLVTNNTGPAHMAAAAGTPVVDLYALTSPQHTPWNVPHRTLFYDVPCKYCYKSVCPEGHHNCLRLVRPEAVYEAAVELLFYRGERGHDTAASRFEVVG